MPTEMPTETPTWGPWGTDLHDIGRVIDPQRGAWWEVAAVIGRMRGRTIVPDVHTESGVHLQAATPDLAAWRWRYQLQWRDVEMVDVDVVAADGDDARVLRLTFHNNDDRPHRYVASLMMRVHGYQRVLLGDDVQAAVGCESYAALGDEVRLPTGGDGFPTAVCMHPDLIDGEGLGFWGGTPVAPFKASFANRQHVLTPGFQATLATPAVATRVWLRLGHADINGFALCINGQPVSLPEPGTLGWAAVDLPQPSDQLTLAVTGGVPGRQPRAVLDAIVIGGDEPPLLRVESQPGATTASLDGHDAAVLHDPALPDWSAAVVTDGRRPVPPEPYGDGALIRVGHGELAGWGVRRKLGNDCLLPWGSHNADLGGDGRAVYHGLAVGPVAVPAGEHRSVYVALACGSGDTLERARRVLTAAPAIAAAGDLRLQQWSDRPGMTTGHRLLLAHTNANVSWPVRRGRQVVACDTPGKRWGGLFTWDSAMHGFGHVADDPQRARTIVATYIGADDYLAAPPLVLHGSPLPFHIHLTWAWFQRTGDRTGLAALLPGLVRLVDWFLARTGSGGPTGLLTTYDQFYNGFGIDDDPLQHRVERDHLGGTVAPVATSAHVARACRTLAALAEVCGQTAEAERLAAAADAQVSALVAHSWNPARERFEWIHLPDGQWFSDHPSGAENHGVDGLAPLCAGLDDATMVDALERAMFDPDVFWTAAGVAAVARDGSPARTDGYWNGSVWVPHQFLLVLGLLVHGRGEAALRLARHLVAVHHEAATATDNSYELFDCDSRQGEGCHNFAGLSSPAAFLHDALTRPGAVTTGMDTIASVVSSTDDDLSVDIHNPVRPGATAVWLVPPAAGVDRVLVNGQPSEANVTDGVIVLRVVCGRDPVRISVTRR